MNKEGMKKGEGKKKRLKEGFQDKKKPSNRKEKQKKRKEVKKTPDRDHKSGFPT